MPHSTHFPATALLIPHDGMGDADELLRRKLLRNYLALLLEDRLLPQAICFYTEGVKLVIDGSPVLDLLHRFEAQGTHLLVCRTCLDYFGLTDQARVGTVGSMHDIIAAQWKAPRVITI